MMTVKEILVELESLGDDARRKHNTKAGAPDNQFGVKLGDIRTLAKKLKADHGLALKLWSTGNVEAQLLATLIMKPASLSAEELDELTRSVTCAQVADWLNAYVVKDHPERDKLRATWMRAKDRWAARAGWNLTAILVSKGADGLDLPALLDRIEREMPKAKPEVQWTMNSTLAAIGIHHAEHRGRAVAIGEAVGLYRDWPVSKGCTPPYVPVWIEAMVKQGMRPGTARRECEGELMKREAADRSGSGKPGRRRGKARGSGAGSTICFTATLLAPRRPDPAATPVSWTFLALPADASAGLPSRGLVTVEGTLNGHPLTATLEPDGQGGHWLKVDRELREAAGVERGDVVTLEVAPVTEEPEPQVPADLRAALAAASPGAREVWSDMTPLARRDWIHWIVSPKRAETRVKRIANACDMLAKGKRRPCCFDRSGMYSEGVSRPIADED